jgi:hypothetical protein
MFKRHLTLIFKVDFLSPFSAAVAYGSIKMAQEAAKHRDLATSANEALTHARRSQRTRAGVC